MSRKEQESGASTPAEAARPHGVRVLVIDDEPELQRAIRTRLTGGEFAVEGAYDGAHGLDLAARWHPDV
ncbi:MAG TPA: response regulator, partial [Ktedonobacterales bacterium]|nr:response regulator [Ktedonobacterales bacterium]